MSAETQVLVQSAEKTPPYVGLVGLKYQDTIYLTQF